MMESVVTSPPVPPPPPVVPVTVMVAEPETTPVNPFILAVIGIEPAPTAVTSPVELTVATLLAGVLQVTRSVTSSLVEG